MTIGRTLCFVLGLALSGCQSVGTIDVASHFGDGRPLSSEITLVSWNLQKAKDPRSIADVAEIIATHDPDLMFVQEISNGDLKSGLRSTAFAPSWSLPWPGATATGVQTLARTAP